MRAVPSLNDLDSVQTEEARQGWAGDGYEGEARRPFLLEPPNGPHVLPLLTVTRRCAPLPLCRLPCPLRVPSRAG